MPAFGEPDVSPGLAFAGRLDLDHLGAMVSHDERELWPGQKLREINDPDSLELQVIPRARNESISLSA